jgi:ArsR family transcriptional regulator, lead/cadmium/zinc/bismuth-responsive transcriptional repressor
MTMPKKIQKELNDEKAIITCAEQFGLVGDPTRMKICWLLCKHKEMPVSEIANILNVSVSVVSHSLKRLKQHELVDTRRNYKQIFYRLTDTEFNRTIKASLPNL